MMSNNETLRKAIKSTNVRYWQVAKELGISPTQFSEKLREELPQSEQARIASICKLISGRES